MAVYLVDSENVSSKTLLKCISDICEKDVIYILYSDVSRNIWNGVPDFLYERKVQVIFRKAFVGTPNALDFQLSSILGYLICEAEQNGKPDEQFILISSDTGYKCLEKFWKDNKRSVTMLNPSTDLGVEHIRDVETSKKKHKKDKSLEAVDDILLGEYFKYAGMYTEKKTDKKKKEVRKKLIRMAQPIVTELLKTLDEDVPKEYVGMVCGAGCAKGLWSVLCKRYNKKTADRLFKKLLPILKPTFN